MDNVVKNADKWVFEKVANQQTLGNAGGSAGSRTPDHLIKSPITSSNISYLATKTLRKIEYKWIICIQICVQMGCFSRRHSNCKGLRKECI